MKCMERREVTQAVSLGRQQRKRRAVFQSVEDENAGRPWRVIYHRTDDTSLTIRLEPKGNASASDVFRFRLRE